MSITDIHTTTDSHADAQAFSEPILPDPFDQRVDLLPTRRARCADGDGGLTELFFSDDPFDIARAKAICSRCPLSASCLAGALERAEVDGVWGGVLLLDGVIVADRPRRGRPPRTPRPALVVDEVPVPAHLLTDNVA